MKTKEKNKIIVVALLCIAVYIIGIVLFICHGKSLEDIAFFSQIYSAVFVVLGVVVAMMQYLISSNEQIRVRDRELEIRERELLDIEKDRIQNAINLANYYKDNVLHYATVIFTIYKDTGINAILENIKLEDMKEFDQPELNKLLTKDQQTEIRKTSNSDGFKKSIIKSSIIFGFEDKVKRTKTLFDNNGNEIETFEINEMEIMREYSNIINKLLNNAEYFAMNFTHETADESVVYQSLHTSYMSFMRVLYFDIAKNNKVGEEKLYTNAIELFNIWRDKVVLQRDNSINMQRSVVNKGKALQIKNNLY